MKIFTICPNYIPQVGAENLVAYKLINKLSEDKTYQVKVLSTKFSYSDKEDDLGINGYNHEIITLNYNKKYSNINILNKIINRIKIINKINWFYESFKILKKEGKKNDFLYTRSTPIESHIIGYIVKKFIDRDIKWIVSFSDPWYNSPYYNKNRIISKLQFYIEEIILNKSDHLILNNKYQKQFFCTNHTRINSNKITIIPHAYDDFLYDTNKIKEKKYNYKKISYIGDLYEKRNCTLLLEAINNKKDKLENKVMFSFYGSMPIVDQEYIKEKKMQSVVEFSGRVGYLESLKIMKESDILLIIDANLDSEYSPYLPSKIVDYFGAKKPIIAFTMKNGATADLIKSTSNYLVDSQNKDEIDKLIIKLIKEEVNIKPNYIKYEEFNIENIVNRFKEIVK